MGLDSVELVLEIEEAFNVEIPDADAQEIRTVGELIHCVRSRLPRGPVCLTSRTFYRLRREILQLLPLARDQIRPGSRVDEIIPKSKRRLVWRRLRASGLRLPELTLPPALFRGASLQVLESAASLALLTREWLVLGVAVPLGLLAGWATRPFAVEVEYGCLTIRDLILHAVPRDRAERVAGSWTHGEVAEKVRLLVSLHSGVPLEKIQDDTRFIEDLGMD